MGGAILFPDEDTSVTILTVPVPVCVCACVCVCVCVRACVCVCMKEVDINEYSTCSNLQLIWFVLHLCPEVA